MCDEGPLAHLASKPDDMKLPAGKTCADCVHFKRCLWLIGAQWVNDKSKRCDFSPSRFHEVTP